MNKLSHLDDKGKVTQVDIADKPTTKRRAKASSRIRMNEAAFSAIKTGNNKKGEVLNTARIAGITAAKKTAELIPLCHPLPLSSISVDFTFGENFIEVIAVVETLAQTGVEMEALMAASLAALTIYDMAKALDKAMVIEETMLLEKSGGQSGDYQR